MLDMANTIEQVVFARGLTYEEVAIIKRMRMMGFKRDYIFSFLLRPGRSLTPACISEVDNRRIAPDVDPATEQEVDIFTSRRLAESGSSGSVFGPLSSFQISQALGWFTRAQGDLLRDETQQVEFKILVGQSEDDVLGYAKTMAAFANNRGGYIFFGVTNERRPVGIVEANFLNYDWDRLSAICRENFQPNIVWDRGLYVWDGKPLGVVYVYEAKKKPVVAARKAKGLAIGGIYYRYRGHTENIGVGDLFNMLHERDERTRAELRVELQASDQQRVRGQGS